MLLNAINLILSKDKTINENQLIRDTIIKLKFIGTFQANEKINVKNLTIEQNNIFTPFKRMIYGESRTTTYDFLNTTIEKSFNIINSFIRTDKLSEKIFCKNILNDLVNSISGLKNIQRTYEDDKLFFCNVQTLIEIIQAKILEIKEQYPYIFNIQTIEEDFFLNSQKSVVQENSSFPLQDGKQSFSSTLKIENIQNKDETTLNYNPDFRSGNIIKDENLNENNNLNKQVNNKKSNK
jgi:hypothetical protein